VDSSVEITGDIGVDSDVNDVRIILMDGCDLKVNGMLKIDMLYGDSCGLKIYGQGSNGGAGILVVDNSGGTASSNFAIRCGRTSEIHGGRLTLKGGATGNGGAGIFTQGTGNSLSIYGGMVNATGRGNFAGICSPGSIYLYGGTVIAQSLGRGAGIGGQYQSVTPKIDIDYDVVVTAYGGEGGAGIGGGNRTNNFGNNLTINGNAHVTAYGGGGPYGGGAGIGSGGPLNDTNTDDGKSKATNGKISIGGNARVNAQGGPGTANNAGGGAGIGSGGVARTTQDDAGNADGQTGVVSGNAVVNAYGGAGNGSGTAGAPYGRGGYISP
jgi:hypothetical protein